MAEDWLIRARALSAGAEQIERETRMRLLQPRLAKAEEAHLKEVIRHVVGLRRALFGVIASVPKPGRPK